MKKRNWKDPYYHYTLPKRKITVDVTGSAPNFEKRVPGLPDVVAEFRDRDVSTILDFGAGNLRNTLYLLNEGFKVWAVEFKETFERPLGQKRLKEAQKHDDFFFVEYPEQFLKFKKKLDAALVINVVNIVPEEADRKKILKECARRLKPAGLLLLMTQHGEPNYQPAFTKRLRVCDGWGYRLHTKYQTFNKEYSIPKLKELVPKKLFSNPKEVRAKHHYAFLFERK